ncbi:hypothetical protein D3C73_1452870 [compost metagenome]
MNTHGPPFICRFKRRDACGLQLRDSILQLRQCLRLFCNAGFGEQILVVDEAVAFNVHRHAIEFAVNGRRDLGGFDQLAHPRLIREIGCAIHVWNKCREAAVVEDFRL